MVYTPRGHGCGINKYAAFTVSGSELITPTVPFERHFETDSK